MEASSAPGAAASFMNDAHEYITVPASVGAVFAACGWRAKAGQSGCYFQAHVQNIVRLKKVALFLALL